MLHTYWIVVLPFIKTFLKHHNTPLLYLRIYLVNISVFLFYRMILLSLTGILALINAFGQDVNIAGVIVLFIYLSI